MKWLRFLHSAGEHESVYIFRKICTQKCSTFYYFSFFLSKICDIVIFYTLATMENYITRKIQRLKIIAYDSIIVLQFSNEYNRLAK